MGESDAPHTSNCAPTDARIDAVTHASGGVVNVDATALGSIVCCGTSADNLDASALHIDVPDLAPWHKDGGLFGYHACARVRDPQIGLAHAARIGIPYHTKT